MRYATHSRLFLLSALLLVTSLLLATSVQAQQATTADRNLSDFQSPTLKQQLQQPFETLEFDQLETGILYDRTNLLSEAGKYDGQSTAAIDYGSWKQLYLEMQMGQVSSASNLPDLHSLKEAAWQIVQEEGVVPILVMNLRYDRLKETAVENGLIERRDGQLYDTSGPYETPYVQQIAFATTAVGGPMRSKTVTFMLDLGLYIENYSIEMPEYFEVDLGDGGGFRRTDFGDRLTASYASNGVKTGRLRAYYPSGQYLESTFTFEVRSYSMPDCDRTWGEPRPLPDIPLIPREFVKELFKEEKFDVSNGTYEGEPAYFTACALYADGHTSLRKPLILVEGFDIKGTLNIEAIYNGYRGLMDDLRSVGFDVVILNFFDAKTYIQRNSEALITLIEDINSLKTGREPNVVVGASMGGLVARYALAKVETHGKEHETVTYVSFDSPHRGANIPLGLQYWVLFHSVSDGAEKFKEKLNSPAARQMLVYHFTTSNDETPLPTQDYIDFYNELRGSGGAVDRAYPRENGMWMVGIANGSGHGRAQRGEDGGPMPSGMDATLIHTDLGHQWFDFDINATAWAVPSGGVRTVVFYGDDDVNGNGQNILERYIDDASSEPYDNAPGGYRASAIDILEAADPGAGDTGFTDYPRHAFVPTVSALDAADRIEGDDIPLFYDFSSDPDLPNKTLLPENQGHVSSPFDIIRFAYESEPHVYPDNIRNFLLEQVIRAPRRVIAGGTISTTKPILRSRNETIARNVTLTAGADVILASGGTVRLGPGFRAEKGSRLRVYALEPPPAPGTTSSSSTLASAEGGTSSSTTAAKETGKAGDSTASAVADARAVQGAAVMPDEFRLGQNFPNPFRGSTEIHFDLPKASEVSLVVYDLLGRRIVRIAGGWMEAGFHRVRFDASGLSSGIYIYRLTAGEYVDVKRMMLVR